LAAAAEGPSLIGGALESRDTQLMTAALGALGADISPGPGGALAVRPGPARPGGAIDVGLAGTVMRFAPPLAALAPGATRFTGDPAAAARPIRPLLDALERLGATVTRPAEGSLPFTVEGAPTLAGGAVSLDATASSQFLSGLLLAGPRFAQGLDISLEPAHLPSRPHVELTVAAMRAFGARIDTPDDFRWRVEPGGLTGQNIQVEADLTTAAPFLAAALATGGRVRVHGWPTASTQPGALMATYLKAFGADRRWHDGVLEVAGTGPIQGVHVTLEAAGELTPTVAALAALAQSESLLDGIGHLRGHETDRLAALAREINRLGGDATETATGLRVRPRALRGGLVRTYGDHRMAMFGAILGLAVPGVELEDVSVTAKTFPRFPQIWRSLAR
jgi:3-phosphoshikimate 1-carboxyvinyltransferase